MEAKAWRECRWNTKDGLRYEGWEELGGLLEDFDRPVDTDPRFTVGTMCRRHCTATRPRGGPRVYRGAGALGGSSLCIFYMFRQKQLQDLLMPHELQSVFGPRGPRRHSGDSVR